MNYQEKIKILCKRRKITLKILSETIGMSEAGFHRSLKDNNLQIKRLQQIADYFNLPLSYFLEESGNNNKVLEPAAPYTPNKRYLEERVSILEQKVEQLLKDKKK